MAIPQRGPHVRELFVKTGPAVGLASFQAADSAESHNTYDLSGGGQKKRRAPAPPAGLGQYKPKILSDSSESNLPLQHGTSDARPAAFSGGGGGGDSSDTASRPSAARAQDAGRSRPFIVGDKDTPLVLFSPPDPYGLEPGIRDLKVSGASNEGEGIDIGSSNPLFELQDPRASGEANGTATELERRKAKAAPGAKEEPDGVFIPAPDYDEDEKTMVFSEELDDDDDELSSEQPGRKVFKEYYGEDFSQYLSDEDNGLGDMPHRQKRSSRHAHDRKSKTEVKRGHYYKKRDSTLPGKKSDFSSKKDTGFQGASSLRNFSYADSKFGTVNGSSRRLSVHSLSEDTEEAELFVSTGSSYEQFLRSKNGEDFPLSESEVPALPKLPSRFAGPAHKKDTLWKKLTWRFKKPPKTSGLDGHLS